MMGPETAKSFALSGLRTLSNLKLYRYASQFKHRGHNKALQKEVFGLTFQNPVGLSAGIDQNGDYYDVLSDFGFGFIEIGSLTAAEDKGYQKPRIFRLSKDKAFISRTGIPNKGVRHAIDNLQNISKRNIIDRKKNIIVASLGQHSKVRKDAEIIQDFEKSFSLMYDFADMFTINISCYDDNNVMPLLNASSLEEIIEPLLSLRRCYERYKPIVVKVSVDVTHDELDKMLDYCRMSGVDGIIVGGFARIQGEFNTGDRKMARIGSGGLSGAPVYERTRNMVKYISEKTKNRFPIIASGGIMTPQQAAEMIEAGASLIQIHSALYYEGPSIVKKILKYLSKK